jgi:hypothetical protein
MRNGPAEKEQGEAVHPRRQLWGPLPRLVQYSKESIGGRGSLGTAAGKMGPVLRVRGF